MNDSFRTNVFVRYYPETIACACIYLAARRLGTPLPSSPPWYALFSVTEEEIQDICITILGLYTRPKPVPDALEKVVNEVKKLHIEAKQRAKGVTSDGNTPNSTSRPSSPSKANLSPLSLPYVKKLRGNDDKSDHSFGSGLDHRHTSRKKRNHSSHSRSRSRSVSSDDRGHRSYGSSSRSVSRSPVAKHRYRSPITKKLKKESRRRRRRHSRDKDAAVTKSRDHDKYYHERDRYRSPSYSPSPEHSRASRKKHATKDKHDYKSETGGHDRQKKKRNNGHRESRTRSSRYRR